MTTHKEALEKANYAYCRTPSNRSNADMEAAIRAYLDARGLVMVPREPSRDMLTAFVDAETSLEDVRVRYEAMISAALKEE